MAYRTADHAMLIARRARDAENRYTQAKKHTDLTEVITYTAAKAPTAERKGVPLGQKWDK